MIFLRGGRPGGIFEKSEFEKSEDEREIFSLFFCFFEFFSQAWTLLDSFFCSHQIVLSSRVKPSKIRVEAFFLRILITKKKTMNEDNTEKEDFEEDFEEEDHVLPFISSRKATRKEEEELRPSFFSLSLVLFSFSRFFQRRTTTTTYILLLIILLHDY